jgi:hypothetical protein
MIDPTDKPIPGALEEQRLPEDGEQPIFPDDGERPIFENHEGASA